MRFASLPASGFVLAGALIFTPLHLHAQQGTSALRQAPGVPAAVKQGAPVLGSSNQGVGGGTATGQGNGNQAGQNQNGGGQGGSSQGSTGTLISPKPGNSNGVGNQGNSGQVGGSQAGGSQGNGASSQSNGNQGNGGNAGNGGNGGNGGYQGGSIQTTSYAAGSGGFGWNSATVCGGNAFATCASVAVNATWDGTGNVTVTMRVTNLSGSNGTYAGTVFTQVGLWNIPGGTSYGNTLTTIDQNNSAVGGWQVGTNGLSGAGMQKDIRGVDAQFGINGGLTAGNTYTFTFTLTNWMTAPDFSTLGFGIHGQGGPNGCSTKLVIDGSGSANAGPYDANCAYTPPPPPNVVPEPVTMSLLATGLAGVGGAGLFRRRRKQADA